MLYDIIKIGIVSILKERLMIETIAEIKQYLKQYAYGKTIGFVPTMGYLHRGHLSLVEQCKRENDVTVVSIFVNPKQFGPDEDFNIYPRDIARDLKLLEDLEVDIVFSPSLAEIYPTGYSTYVEMEKLGEVLCGKSRPGHFRGVATIVLKLFNIVEPTRAYFGQKDAQQAVVIKKMVNDLNLDIVIRIMPIVRDPDGLALSSRNVYLSRKERAAALCMQVALQKVRTKILDGLRDVSLVKDMLQRMMNKELLIKVDYLEVVSLDGLEKLEEIDMRNTLVAVAIWVGNTRLIDNFILGEI
jgi:pantoate--beta-alanine ligase